MGRKSTRVKGYIVGKGDFKGYWGIEALKDLLWDIHRGNKSWGEDWYTKYTHHCYDSAKVLLAIYGKGEDVGKAIDIINRIADLEAEDD